MGTEVSKSEYARHRGVSPAAITKAIRAGRIKALANGKIDREAADARWAANTDLAQVRERPAKPAAPAKHAAAPARAAAAPTRPAPPAPPADPPTGAGVDYTTARAIREGWLARMARLEYEEKVGTLVRKDDVKVKAFNAARAARDKLLAIPGRLAPLLVNQASDREIEKLIAAEIRRVCEELGQAVAGELGL